MKERPILFSGPMVRAILAGQKTQTRRIVKLPKWEPMACIVSETLTGPKLERIPNEMPYKILKCADSTGRHAELHSPYGKPGDRLWVRETFSPDAVSMYPCPPAWYCASDDIDRSGFHTCPKEHRGNYADCLKCWEEREHSKFKWRPSIHMPRRVSRITLEITAIRVERLQSISESDAIAEGCEPACCQPQPCRCAAHPTTYRAGYAKLWDSINAKDRAAAIRGDAHPWESNPWVWVIEFRKL